MAMQTYTTEDVHAELVRRVEAGTYKSVGDELGCSYQHVFDLVIKRRSITGNVARGLGFVALPKAYVRVEDYEAEQANDS